MLSLGNIHDSRQRLLQIGDKGTTFLVNNKIKIKALLLSQSNAFFVVNKIFRIIAE